MARRKKQPRKKEEQTEREEESMKEGNPVYHNIERGEMEEEEKGPLPQ